MQHINLMIRKDNGIVSVYPYGVRVAVTRYGSNNRQIGVFIELNSRGLDSIALRITSIRLPYDSAGQPEAGGNSYESSEHVFPSLSITD